MFLERKAGKTVQLLREDILEEEVALPRLLTHRTALAAWARVGGRRGRVGSRSRMGITKGRSSAPPLCRLQLSTSRAGRKPAPRNLLRALQPINGDTTLLCLSRSFRNHHLALFMCPVWKC